MAAESSVAVVSDPPRTKIPDVESSSFRLIPVSLPSCFKTLLRKSVWSGSELRRWLNLALVILPLVSLAALSFPLRRNRSVRAKRGNRRACVTNWAAFTEPKTNSIQGWYSAFSRQSNGSLNVSSPMRSNCRILLAWGAGSF